MHFIRITLASGVLQNATCRTNTPVLKEPLYGAPLALAQSLDGLDLKQGQKTGRKVKEENTHLEVKGYQRKDQSLQILHEVVEDTEAFRVR